MKERLVAASNSVCAPENPPELSRSVYEADPPQAQVVQTVLKGSAELGLVEGEIEDTSYRRW